MSFDVHLFASSKTPEPEAFKPLTSRVLQALGATGGLEDGNITLSDGAEFELFAGGGGGAMFALRGLTPSIAEAIFAVAEATGCFIFADSDGFLRTPTNDGDLPDGAEDMAVETVETAGALFQSLSGGFSVWADYRDRIVSSEPQPILEASEPAPSEPLPASSAPAPVKNGWFASLFSKS